MMIRLSGHEVPARVIEDLEHSPTHAVVVELSEAALASRSASKCGYKRLMSFLLDRADGRDRREPWTTRPGNVRPVPKLRLSMEECFGRLGDLHWFNLNKRVNASRRPLVGLFPRMPFLMGRVRVKDLGTVVATVLSASPDAALLKLLQKRGGRIPGVGVKLFSQLAYAHRPDLYFPLPEPWSTSSGCRKYVGSDLRRYCELCRNLRGVCDDLGVPEKLRGGLLDHLLSQKTPPLAVVEAIGQAIGPTLARYGALEPDASYEGPAGGEDLSAMPADFAVVGVRARRGRRELRQTLLRDCGERCAVTGDCLRDLLEVAYIAPFPGGDPHSPRTAMLLRSDVHTLWDLNLIGVEPTTRRVYVAERLTGTTYEQLAGRTLRPRLDGRSVDSGVLRDRWRLFTSAHRIAVVADEPTLLRQRERAPRADSEPRVEDAVPRHRREVAAS